MNIILTNKRLTPNNLYAIDDTPSIQKPKAWLRAF